jgi:hypothetical protein
MADGGGKSWPSVIDVISHVKRFGAGCSTYVVESQLQFTRAQPCTTPRVFPKRVSHPACFKSGHRSGRSSACWAWPRSWRRIFPARRSPGAVRGGALSFERRSRHAFRQTGCRDVVLGKRLRSARGHHTQKSRVDRHYPGRCAGFFGLLIPDYDTISVLGPARKVTRRLGRVIKYDSSRNGEDRQCSTPRDVRRVISLGRLGERSGDRSCGMLKSAERVVFAASSLNC